MLTTSQVLECSGIKSGKTLTRYAQRDLLPPIRVQRHSKGRGRVGYWPEWVVRRIQEIQQRLAEGKTLNEIADELGSDWPAEERRLIRRRPDFRAALERERRYEAVDQVADTGSDLIYRFLRRLGIARPGIAKRLEDALSDNEIVDRVLVLMRQGCSPMIIFFGEEIQVVPDFMLPHVFSRIDAIDQPAIVVPARALFLRAFERAEPTLPKQIKYAPDNIVVDRAEGKPKTRRFTPKGKWDFTIK